MAIPYETEEKLLDFLKKLDDEVETSKGDLEKRMSDNLDQVRGKQWKSNKAPYFLYNVIEAGLEDKAGKLSETKPQISVLPRKNGLDNAAKMLTKVASSIWDCSKMEYKTERIAYYGALAGAAFVGTTYNRNLADGLGDVELMIKDPRACGMDMSITAGEDGDLGEYATFMDFIPLDVIRDEYPGRGALVVPDEKTIGYDSVKTPTTQGLLRGTYSRLFKKKGEPEHKSVIPKAIMREYYIQDRRKSIEDTGLIPLVDGITKWAPKGGAPFPGGRRIIRAGDIILLDEANPYWDGGYPIDMLSWKVDLESAWGADEIQSVKRMQEAVNRLGDAYTKTTILNSVVRVIMETNALSPTERNKLSNEVAQIIEKTPGRALEYMTPQMLPPEVINFVNTLMGWIRQKMGVQEIPTSKQVPSIVTGPAIEGLQLMVEGPIRTAARRIEEFYTRVGQKIISRVFQFYTADRLMHQVGPDNTWTEFEFYRLQILKDSKGKPREGEDLRKAFRDFSFRIAPGSSLAVTKTTRAVMKMQLLQLGLLHPEEVLLEFFDNPKDKLEKAQEAKQGGLFDIIQSGSKASPPAVNTGNLAA